MASKARPDPPLHRGIYEVHLPVTDLGRSIDFYSETLGFELAFGERGDSSALLLYSGGSGEGMREGRGEAPAGEERWMLGLFRVDAVAHRHPAEHHVAFRVPEEKVDEMVPFLRSRGVEPVHPPTAPAQGPMREPIVHGWMPAAAVFFRDPDGHLLELIAELSGAPRPDVVYCPLSQWRSEVGGRS